MRGQLKVPTYMMVGFFLHLLPKTNFLGQENTLALIHPSASEGIESVEASRKEKSVPLSKLEELNQVSKIHF